MSRFERQRTQTRKDSLLTSLATERTLNRMGSRSDRRRSSPKDLPKSSSRDELFFDMQSTAKDGATHQMASHHGVTHPSRRPSSALPNGSLGEPKTTVSARRLSSARRISVFHHHEGGGRSEEYNPAASLFLSPESTPVRRRSSTLHSHNLGKTIK
jgi:hypothetical protein